MYLIYGSVYGAVECREKNKMSIPVKVLKYQMHQNKLGKLIKQIYTLTNIIFHGHITREFHSE